MIVVLSNAKDLALIVVLNKVKDLVLRSSEPTRSFERWNSPQDDTPSVVLNKVKDLALSS